MFMKRLITAILLAALLLVSCGSASESTMSADTDNNNNDMSTDDTVSDTELTDGIPDIDLNGTEFTIVYSADQLGESWPYDAETENGDLLNDSVYARNKAMLDRFNVSVVFHNVGGTGGEVSGALINQVNAGDSAYGLGIAHTFSNVSNMVSNGYAANFKSLPYIDISKPWWNATVGSNLEICGILPIGISDLVYSYADVIFVNNDLISNFSLESPYDLTFDGRWTWTKLAEMAKAAAADLDGNGTYDQNDRYGFTFPGETVSLASRMIHSNGLMLAESDGGVIKLLAPSDRLQDVAERYYDLLYTGNQTYIGSKTDKLTSVQLFNNGSALFMHQTTLQLPSMRETEVNFGVVPLPKYDEAQENYSSMLSSQVLLIPVMDSASLELSGMMTEALSYESYKRIIPAVYDSIFENKYLRDSTSYEMYQQIRESLVCDMNWNYGNGNKITYVITNVVVGSKSTDVTSYLAAETPKVEAEFEALFEAIRAKQD